MEHEIIDFCDFWMRDGLRSIGVTQFHGYQKEILFKCVESKRVAGLWARQSGKSTTVSAYCLYMCLTNPNFKVIVVAPTQEQSSELYVKMRRMAEESMLVKDKITSSTQTEMVFINGSRVKALPCGPEGTSIRGFTADILIIEEAGKKESDGE